MPDSDQENYSLDEMMRRLKSRGQGGGSNEPQLVTREDGTQVVRVRKRKRRSRQPHKEAEQRRRKRSLIIASLTGGGVLLVGLALLAWVLVINGSGYQDKVESRIEAWTGAEVEMRSFRATPVSAGIDLVQARWPESSPVASLRVHQLRTDLAVTSHLTGVWRGEQLRASAGEMVLRNAPKPGVEDSLLPDSDLPFRMPMRVSRFRVVFGDGERPAMTLSDSTASFVVPNPGLSEANLILEGGKSRIGRWGRFDLNLASFGLSSQGLRLSRLRISPEKFPEAEIQLSGDGYPTVPIRGGKGEFGISFASVPSATLLGERLANLIDGTFESATAVGRGDGPREGICELDPSDLSTLSFEAVVRASESNILQIHHLPMLDELSKLLSNPRFTSPRFDPGSHMRISRDVETIELSDLDFRAEGILRLRGELVEQRGKLSGSLEVGLPDALVGSSSSPALARLFTRGADGYRWATVELSGTAQTPKDDLAEQLQAAREGRSPTSGGGGEFDQEWRDLTTPGE